MFRREFLKRMAFAALASGMLGTEFLVRAPRVASDGVFEGSLVYVTAGTGAGQLREVVRFDGGVMTVVPNWTVQPDQTSTFQILPGPEGG